jgi:hypothetical protein
LLAVLGPLLAPALPAELAAGALAAGFAGAAAAFFWPLAIEVPSSNTATMHGKYRCAFMEFSF